MAKQIRDEADRGVLMLCVFLFWMAWEQHPVLQIRLRAGNIILAVLGLAALFVTQIYQAAFGMTAASASALAVGVLLVCAANLDFVFGSAGVWHFAFAYLFILTALPMLIGLYGFGFAFAALVLIMREERDLCDRVVDITLTPELHEIRREGDKVFIGAVEQDSSGYPDCRPEFIAACLDVSREVEDRFEEFLRGHLLQIPIHQDVSRSEVEYIGSSANNQSSGTGIFDPFVRLQGGPIEKVLTPADFGPRQR